LTDKVIDTASDEGEFSMKINNSIKTVGNITGASVPARDAKAESANAKPAAGASVATSGLSSQLQALEAQMSGGQVVDAARVSKIKQAMSEGRFKVDPDVVADRLMETVRELISAYKR
jgi:negative regulator of flagellin synthesis FlgM